MHSTPRQQKIFSQRREPFNALKVMLMEGTSKKINSNIPEILKKYKTIAVVGISDKPERDSYRVAQFMLSRGYTVYPINPAVKEVLGLPAYPSLTALPHLVELVDIFRKSEYVLPIVEEAIQKGARAIWMQIGVINSTATQKALDAGLEVVMDRCWKVEYLNHFSINT